MNKQLRPALTLFVALSLVTGLAYPLAVTGIAQLLFANAANGSLVLRDGRPVGSSLIGQSFSDPGHFWGRPSATSPRPYDAANSGGPNLAPTAPALVDAVKSRLQALRAADPGNTAPVPVDLVTASASGLAPPHQPGRRGLPGSARRPRPRAAGGPRAGSHRRAHRGPPLRLPRRAARQRPGAQPRAGACDDDRSMTSSRPPC